MILAWIAAAAAAPALEDAAVAEVQRAAGMKLPDADAAYFVSFDVLDGNVSSCFAEGGARVSSDASPYRELRADVRSGSYHEDSSNVAGFGDGGITSRGLPVDNQLLALRREAWLAVDAAYKSSVEALSRKLAARRGQPPHAWDDFAHITPVTLAYEAPVAPMPLETACGLTERLSAAIEAAGVEQGQAVLRDWQGTRLTVSNEGTRAWRPTRYTVLRVDGTTVLADGTEAEDARSWVVRAADELPDETTLLAAAHAVGTWLAGLEAAPKEDDYLGPVLFEDEATVELFSQLLANELVGTPPEEDADDDPLFRAPPAPIGRIGRRLLPAGWSVVDDVSLYPDAAAHYTLDHEGVAPRRVDLVRDGVVRDLLMSRTPSKDRATSTGHGRSLGTAPRTAVPAAVRITAPKLQSARALRRRALQLAADTGRDYFLVVRHLTPPAMTQDIDFSMTGEGPPPGLGDPYEVSRVYADGHEVAVRPMQFSGVDRRVLRDVVAAGAGPGPVQTLDGPPGVSRYGIGPTGGLAEVWDVPSVLVAEVELTAKTGGEPRVLKPR